MAINTGDGTRKSLRQLSCSSELTSGVHNELIMLMILNILVSVTAILGNTLILLALNKVSSLHSPSKLLFRNLATTDILNGIIIEPLFAVFLFSITKGQWNICHYIIEFVTVVGYSLCGVSILTMASISVDRLLALLSGMRYRQVVTRKRVWMTVVFTWIVASVGSVMYLWDQQITIWYAQTVILLCLVTSLFSYSKIFLKLRHNRVQAQGHIDQDHASHGVSSRMARYRKTVYSVLWVKLALVICYLPYLIVNILMFFTAPSHFLLIVFVFSVTCVFLNSTLNPILYCWKIEEVRGAVKDTIRQLFAQ